MPIQNNGGTVTVNMSIGEKCDNDIDPDEEVSRYSKVYYFTLYKLTRST